MSVKRCSKCGKMKSLEAFRKDKGRRDGLYPYCRSCESQWNKTYRQANPDKVRARGRAYKAANREKVLEYNRHYRETHRDELREQGRAYSKSHRERGRENWRRYAERRQEYMRERARTYWWANREERIAKLRAYRHANPDKMRAQRRAYRLANPDKFRSADRLQNGKRNARLSAAEGSFTAEDITLLHEVQEGCCAWCSEPLNGKYHVDHIIPLSRHGTNWSENLVLACAQCNLSKHDKLPFDEWKPPMPLSLISDKFRLMQ